MQLPGFGRTRRAVRYLLSSFVAAGCSLLLSAGAASAQAHTRVRFEVSCAGCRIVADSILSFGKASDPELLASATPVAIDSRGRLFAVSHDLSRVVVFDSGGKYLAAFGRKGAGPGEFNGAIQNLHVDRSDSIHVTDAGKRVSVFTPSLRFVRTVLLNARSSGRVVLSADETFAWSLTDRYELAGTDLRTSGTSMRVSVDSVPWLPRSRPSIPNKVAAARMLHGRSSDAAHQGNVVIAGIDSAGLIWLNTYRPSSAADRPGTRRVFIEVIDPLAGKLLVSAERAGGFHFLPRSNLATVGSVDRDGVVTKTLYRVALKR